MGRINTQLVKVLKGNNQLIITVTPAQDLTQYNNLGGFFQGTVRLDVYDGLILITVPSPSGPVFINALRELLAGESVDGWFDSRGNLVDDVVELADNLTEQQLRIIERTPELMQLS